jgi:hypothetical protein
LAETDDLAEERKMTAIKLMAANRPLPRKIGTGVFMSFRSFA